MAVNNKYIILLFLGPLLKDTTLSSSPSILCRLISTYLHVNTDGPTNTQLQGERRTLFSVNALDSEAKLWLFPWSYRLKVILDGTDRLILPLPGTQWNDAPPKTSGPSFSFPNISPLITAQAEKQTNRGTLPWRQCFSPTHKSQICSQSSQTGKKYCTAEASHSLTGHRDCALQQPLPGYFNNPQHVCLMVRARQEMIGKWNEAAGYYWIGVSLGLPTINFIATHFCSQSGAGFNVSIPHSCSAWQIVLINIYCTIIK